MSLPVCSREAEAASVTGKLLDGSPTASGTHSLYGSHPATALSYGSSPQGGNGFPGPSPSSLSSPPMAATLMSQSPPDSCTSKIENGQGTPQWKGWKFADASPPTMKTAVRSAPRLPPSGQAPCGNDLQKAAGDAPSATEKQTTPSDQGGALPPATAVHPLAPFLEAEREKRENARRRQQEVIEVLAAEQARKLNQRDRLLAQEKAREIIRHVLLPFAGSRNVQPVQQPLAHMPLCNFGYARVCVFQGSRSLSESKVTR